MPAPMEELRRHLKASDFEKLWVEGLGWNHHRAEPFVIRVDGHDYSLSPIAEKKDFLVLECTPDGEGGIPGSPVRQKIESRVTKLAFEHIIFFLDEARSTVVCQWAKRIPGQPPAYRRHVVSPWQSGTSLLQRLMRISFSLDEESGLTISTVADRVARALDVERVTRAFYERFQRELKKFTQFIDGIQAQGDRDWYASLMLNRMMFIYFIQRQGFLDGDRNYLSHRLSMMQSRGDKGRFHRFYREFLLCLFHEGLGQPEDQRDPKLAETLGNVPFLNGGLFDVHALERENPAISIPDEAFERVFRFFDSYHWHLDDRPGRDDNEINPDVLGYIFEKFINQKEKGAYYTKEDVTGFMTKSTLIPYLLEEVKSDCEVAFACNGSAWKLLRDDPDQYMFPSVGHGIAWNYSTDSELRQLERPHSLPEGMGISDSDLLDASAPGTHGLPGESWRQVVARRRRYTECRELLASGGDLEIDDLITLNLDLERFASDVIVQSEGPELVRAFWRALTRVSVLDPTCGSGAFLFAALNVLEPLYQACLDGMRGFVHDLKSSTRPQHPRALEDFRSILSEVDAHPSPRYFILKSIVLNNLYGVDIMEEAVEICKLRLFLKLVAQLDSPSQIEPLPDIDFNIRSGNTLVGFSSLADVRDAVTGASSGQYRTPYAEEQALLQRIERNAEGASRAFDVFRQRQTEGRFRPADKTDLRRRLDRLRSELDRYLAGEYGVGLDDRCGTEVWRERHSPFHWLAEFYDLMTDGGGFDVIIGNPPYISRREVEKSYRTRGFATAQCPDIYAQVLERSHQLCRSGGRIGMILPLSLTFSRGFKSLRELLFDECGRIWFSSFGRIPSALFSHDVRVRNTIYIATKDPSKQVRCATTRLHRWFNAEREFLFANLAYAPCDPAPFDGAVPKLSSTRLLRAFSTRLEQEPYRLEREVVKNHTGHSLHFKRTAYNWLTVCKILPPAFGKSGEPVKHTKYGPIAFPSPATRDLVMGLANTKLMFLWWMTIGDDFDVTRNNLLSAPFGPNSLSPKQQNRILERLPALQEAMAANVDFKLNAGKQIGNYNLRRCRHITDEIDRLLLEALDLSHLRDEIDLEHSLFVRTDSP